MKKYFVFCFALVLFLSGCNPINPILKSVFEDQQGNLRVLYSRNYADYIYDKKVHLCYGHGRREDSLGLYLDHACGKEKIILKADFKKAAFENERLIILSDNMYYVLDISSYVIPEYPAVSFTNSLGIEVTEDADIRYDLQKYSVEAFEADFPDNEAFEWISW